MVEIRPCTVDEILNTPELVAEYSTYAMPGMPAPNVQWDQYRMMEKAGVIHVIGAFVGGQMVGFVSVLSHVSLHYGHKIALTESLFVASAHRKGGAGIKLIRAVVEYAATLRAVGLLVVAPFGGELSKVLPEIGFLPSQNVYWMVINHE